MQRRWRIAFAGAVTAVIDAGLGVLFVLFVSGRRPGAWRRAVPVVPLRRLVRPLPTAVRAHPKIASVGVGTAVIAAGLGVLLLSGGRSAAAQRAVPVARPPVPVMHLAHLPIRPLPDARDQSPVPIPPGLGFAQAFVPPIYTIHMYPAQR